MCNLLFECRVSPEASWQEAENHCKTLCGHLFSFKEEQDLKDVASHVLEGAKEKSYYWTGLRYVNSSWTFADGEDIQYAITNFTETLGLRLKPNGKCAALVLKRGTDRPNLYTRTCTVPYNFICQFYGRNDCTSSACSSSTSWQEAENHCKTLCGHLFSFKEEQDLKDVAQHVLKGVAQHVLKGAINKLYFWTGLRYVNDSWSFSDGEDTGYAISNLADLQPRPGGNQSGRSRKCVRLQQNQTPLRPTPMKWMCNTLHCFICQFHGNGCTSVNYYGFGFTHSHSDAQLQCQSQFGDGGNLASFSSQDDIDRITTVMVDKNMYCWTGFKYTKSTDSWSFTDGTDTKFALLKVRSQCCNSDMCALILGDGKLYSANCSKSRQYICQTGRHPVLTDPSSNSTG
ncbi:Hypothetical predicted protein [Paramuricea clavata]|uniref:Uncharacterized protein n=1 Tax=Paramuricea clavata TaxID=317549 RepID=A0A7D9IK41_PARCT|nr:Hypothetical predicted protein [Paramuricea clavata]